MCFSQIENATITYAELDFMTTYSIPAQRFEQEFKSDCDTIVVSSEQEIEGLAKALCSIKDTIYQEKVPDKIVNLPNGESIRFIMYPRMNTRGKISINFKNGNSKTYYYDRFTIWEATEDKLYSMTDTFLSYIRGLPINKKKSQGIKHYNSHRQYRLRETKVTTLQEIIAEKFGG